MLLGLAVTGLAIGAVAAVGWVVHVATTGPTLDTRKPIDLGATSAVYADDGTRLGFIPARRCACRSPRRSHPSPAGDRRDRGPPLLQAQGRRLRGHPARRGQERRRRRHPGRLDADDAARPQPLHGRARAHRRAGYKRKIREAKLAEDLENRHPGRPGKIWILDKYLNSVPYGTVGGQTAVGLQAASRMFFDKPASKLTLRQAALLAGLPQAPSAYNPFLDPGAPSGAATRSCRRWPTRATSARRPRRRRCAGLGVRRNRFFTERREGYFFDYVKSKLIERYGLDAVRKGGLRVDTTIDLHLQRLARAHGGPARRPGPRRGDRHDRPPHGLDQGDGVLLALRRLEVQPRRAGPPPGRVDLQGHGAHDGDPARGEPRVDDLRVAPAAGRVAGDGAGLRRQDVRERLPGLDEPRPGDAALRQLRVRPARRRPRPRGGHEDRADMGITVQLTATRPRGSAA